MFTVYIVNNFIYFVKGFDVKNKHFYLPFVCVHICTVSDTLHALQRSAPGTICPARPVLYGLPCCLSCSVVPGALDGAGVHRRGIQPPPSPARSVFQPPKK
nr:MAG TPA: hypothetical protein [Caudoviricetes sp.]DAJ19793.1 MAG TPA: hypothetical protein [Siphoviridae sp. cthBp9]